MIAMLGWLSEASARRFVAEVSDRLGVAVHPARQHLERDAAIEARVAGEIDLAHAARAERAEDLVGAHAGAGPPSGIA